MTTPLPWLAREQLIRSAVPADRIQAVVEYVNRLFEAHYLPEELPRPALVCYYTDFYADTVADGGFDRFLTCSRMEPFVLDRIREGLAACGASGHADLFDRALRDVQRWDPLIRNRLRRGELSDLGCIAQLRKHRDDFLALERELPALAERNAQMVPGQPGPLALDHGDFERRMHELAMLDTTRQVRRSDTEAALWGSRSPPERAIRAWGMGVNRPVVCLTGRGTMAWRSQITKVTYFRAGGEQFRAVQVEEQRIAIIDEANREHAILALGPFSGPRPPSSRRQVSVPSPVQPARPVAGEKGSSGWTIFFIVMAVLMLLRMLLRTVQH